MNLPLKQCYLLKKPPTCHDIHSRSLCEFPVCFKASPPTHLRNQKDSGAPDLEIGKVFFDTCAGGFGEK